MSSIPANHGPERENWILDQVLQKNMTWSWATIENTYKGHKGVFTVMADALRFEGLRVNVSATTQQSIADLTNCLLLTPLLADLCFLQASLRIPPQTRPVGDGSQMATTAWMLDHSQKVDTQISKNNWNGQGIVSTAGKHWCVGNILFGRTTGTALNYGWHFTGSTFGGQAFSISASMLKDPQSNQTLRLIQGHGTAHDRTHTDYSQTCTLVSRRCLIDNQPMDLLDVLQDPELAGTANHDGVLKVTRQPGVEGESFLYDPAPPLVVDVNDLPLG